MTRNPRKHRKSDPWVGPWLMELRTRNKITRDQIAERLRRNTSTVGRIENGLISIAADDLPSVLLAYGATPAEYASAARRRSGAVAA